MESTRLPVMTDTEEDLRDTLMKVVQMMTLVGEILGGKTTMIMEEEETETEETEEVMDITDMVEKIIVVKLVLMITMLIITDSLDLLEN